MQVGFRCEAIWDETYLRRLNNSEFDKIIKEHENLEDRIVDIAKLYLDEIKFLAKNKKPDVILCALGENFITYIQEDVLEEISDDEDDDEEKNKEASTSEPADEELEEEISLREQNFRRYLKAKAMQFNVPIQIVRDRIAKPTSEMQDEATIAWNFFTALYYKKLAARRGHSSGKIQRKRHAMQESVFFEAVIEKPLKPALPKSLMN